MLISPISFAICWLLSIPMQLSDSQCLYELPVCHYNLYKRSFVLRNLFLGAYWLFIDLLCCVYCVLLCCLLTVFFYNFLMAFVRLSLNCIVYRYRSLSLIRGRKTSGKIALDGETDIMWVLVKNRGIWVRTVLIIIGSVSSIYSWLLVT